MLLLSACQKELVSEEKRMSGNIPQQEVVQPHAVEAMYTARISDGKISLYNGTDTTPFRVLKTELKELTVIDRENLERGIFLNTKEELLLFIEDFES